MSASKKLLEIKNLKRHFDVSSSWLSQLFSGEGKQVLKAVDGISLEIEQGKTFSLVGESGCGKSTMAKLVMGLYAPTEGEIAFDGISLTGKMKASELAAIRRRKQMIFQDPYSSLNPRWLVKDIVAEPIYAQSLMRGKNEIQARVKELLLQVGLSAEDGEKYPHEFSGGQRQRISIARVLASQSEFIVCDEPTSALDVSVQAQILNLMKDLQRTLGLTYLFISHNLAVVYHISDTVGVMYLGKLVEVQDKKSLFNNPKHPYTRMLLDTIPDLHMSERERMPVSGEVPSPIAPPSGCSFHPRCPFANERCSKEAPGYTEISGGRVACHAVEEGRIPDYNSPTH